MLYNKLMNLLFSIKFWEKTYNYRIKSGMCKRYIGTNLMVKTSMQKNPNVFSLLLKQGHHVQFLVEILLLLKYMSKVNLLLFSTTNVCHALHINISFHLDSRK